MLKLTHYTRKGAVRMVDVSSKPATERTAVAHAFIRIAPAALRAIRRLRSPKGSPLEIARIAGIVAAKRTSELIPLCHPLPITHADVEALLRKNGVEITSRVTTTAPTGVEMEALTAAAVAALTVYDMTKALDRTMEITELYLLEKRGGKSGPYRRAKKRQSPDKQTR
ncbi:MAG: cyclic pyranopterin monophosphate synthase MoaC [Acidobacteriota bacterium]|nr:cyclic pyranopterin monophosphate synthase MoaC [Acidobacteriota bacterium]